MRGPSRPRRRGPRFDNPRYNGPLAPLTHRARAALLLLVVLVAYAAPRAVAYRGLRYTSTLSFGDMQEHLHNIDLLLKERTLPRRVLDDPYLTRNRHLLQTYIPQGWTHGVYQVAVPLAGWFGSNSLYTVQLTNLLFTLVLVAGLAGLGHALGSVRLGLWGALLTVLCPALAASSFYFSLDYPLMAMVAVGLWLLTRCRGFTAPGPVLCCTLWSSLGVYVKPAYALLLLLPAAVVLASGLRQRGARLRALALGGGSAAATFALSSWLIGGEVGALWRWLVLHLQGGSSLPAPHAPLTLMGLSAYARYALGNFPWPLLLLLLPGLALFHLRADARHRAVLLSFLWGGYLLFTLLGNKMERYLQPLYPVLCLLGAWGASRRAPRWRRLALPAMAACFGALLLYAHLRRPTPWHLEELLDPKEYPFWELRMPTQKVLQGLRRHTYHPTCELGPLLDALQGLASRGPTHRPLGLLVVEGWEPGPERSPAIPFLRWALHNNLAHRLPGQLVYGLMERRQSSQMQTIPRLILLARPGALHRDGAATPFLRAEMPRHRIQATATAPLRCDPPTGGPAPTPVDLVLLRYRGGSATAAAPGPDP